MSENKSEKNQKSIPHAEQVKKLAEMIKGIQFTMFTTVSSEGMLHSSPMTTQQTEFDGTLWFFASASSAKNAELKDNPQVNLAYCEPKDNRYISVSGEAKFVRDLAKAKELWSPALKAWFPRGLEDPDLALIRVDVQRAEYWDFTSSKAIQIYGFVKALVTGKPYSSDEHPEQHQKVAL